MSGFKKHSIIVIVLAIATLISLSFFSFNNTDAKKIYSGRVKTKVTLHSATLKWGVPKKAKKKIDYYVIYKKKVTKAYKKTIKKNRDSIKLPSDSKYKKVKKVSKHVRTYTNYRLKKNQCYSYFVKGFKKKKAKDQLVYQSKKRNAVTGVVPAYVEEAFDDELGFTEKWAMLEYNCNPIKNTRGAKIYRVDLLYKVKGGKYKKVDSLNKKQLLAYTFLDKKMKAGKTYYFKARSYARIGGKRLTKMSAPLVHKMVNDNAKIKVESTTKPSVTDNAILKITSASKYNGDICFSEKYNYVTSQMYNAESKDGETKVDVLFDISMYSYDNKNWFNLTNKVIKLKPQKDIYLKVEFYNRGYSRNSQQKLEKAKINYMGSDAKQSTFWFDEIHPSVYCGNSKYADWVDMKWDLVEQKNYCYQDFEGV